MDLQFEGFNVIRIFFIYILQHWEGEEDKKMKWEGFFLGSCNWVSVGFFIYFFSCDVGWFFFFLGAWGSFFFFFWVDRSKSSFCFIEHVFCFFCFFFFKEHLFF